MPRITEKPLTQAAIKEALRNPPAKGVRKLSDGASVRGLYLAVMPSGNGSWRLTYRHRGMDKTLVIGEHTQPLGEIRKAAAAAKLAVDAGRDPQGEKQEAARQSMTVGDFWPTYLRSQESVWKPSTKATMTTLWERYLAPRVANRPLAEIDKPEVERIRDAIVKQIREKPAVAEGKTKKRGRPARDGKEGGGHVGANQSIRLLRAIWYKAEERDIVSGKNPCHKLKPLREKRHERFLDSAELARLFAAIAEEERLGGKAAVEKSDGRKSAEAESRGITPHAAALIRILIFTGARLGEIQNLTWDAVRWEEKRLRLADSKTGQKVIELPAPAVRELERLRDIASPGCPWVIEGRLAGTRLQNATKAWMRIRKRAGLEDVRIHDLRHNAASWLVSGGTSLHITAKVLGHADSRTSQRYSHLAADPVKKAIEDAAARMEAAANAPTAKVEPIAVEEVTDHAEES